MSDDSIFLLSDDESDPFVELRAKPYDSEEVLQTLLAEHPDLLAGRQMNSEVPRRWLLVSREFGVPKEEGGAGWWSLDHLFVDQDGVPTFVEVKQSSNTEIRRQIVGQMLDYAANGTRYWPIDLIRSAFEEQCEMTGRDADVVLAAHVGDGADGEAFWATVARHLLEGKVRMVFFADLIPPELQRIIEFLNEHMPANDVLGVEVRQYVGSGRRTLVPRVIGLTGAAQQIKVGAGHRPRYSQLLADAPPEVRELEARLLAWAEELGLGTRLAAASRQFVTADGRAVLQLYPSYGVVEFAIEPLRQAGRAADADSFLGRLTALASKKLALKYPNVPCTDLLSAWDSETRRLLGDWVTLVRNTAVIAAPFSYGSS